MTVTHMFQVVGNQQSSCDVEEQSGHHVVWRVAGTDLFGSCSYGHSTIYPKVKDVKAAIPNGFENILRL